MRTRKNFSKMSNDELEDTLEGVVNEACYRELNGSFYPQSALEIIMILLAVLGVFLIIYGVYK